MEGSSITFRNCTIDKPTGALLEGYNATGWKLDLIFENGITYSGNASTNCVFNNCRFKDTVNISIELDSCFVQFNNCIFEKAPTFDYFGKTNSEFNDCILPSSESYSNSIVSVTNL